MTEQHTLNEVILDGISVRSWSAPNYFDNKPFQMQMLRVIERVTNKELIPWYHSFVEGARFPMSEWKKFGIKYCRGRGRGIAIPHKLNMSGLGLEGHVDLGSLPQSVIKMDLSNNNLSGISFYSHGVRGPFGLRSLKIHNNNHLRIDLMHLNMRSKLCYGVCA